MRMITRCALVICAGYFSQSIADGQCDNCPPPQVVIYGLQMNVPMPPPDDSTTGSYTTTASRQALFNWIALEDVIVPLGAISNNDPEKDCVKWSQGSLANQLATLPDSSIRYHMENYWTGDVPDTGSLGGVDYLIWASLDSSAGQYHFRVYLEDGNTRERIAQGEADFASASNAVTAAGSAISQIEPVFDKVRAYQKSLRDGDPTIALSAQITIIPSQSNMNALQTIPVNFLVEDCDGAPLRNVTLLISGSEGNFDQPSVVTDADGKASANFTAYNVTDVAYLTAAYYPYKTPTHKQRGSHGNAFININNPGLAIWQLNINDSRFIEDNSFLDTTYNTGGYDLMYTDDVLQSSGHYKQYVLSTITDSSITTTDYYGGSGDLTVSTSHKHADITPYSFVNQSGFEAGILSNDETFTNNLQLSGGSLGFLFVTEVLYDGTYYQFGYTRQLINNQWYTDQGSSANPFKDYGDVYLISSGRVHNSVSFSGTNSGWHLIGNDTEDSLVMYTSNNHSHRIVKENVDIVITPYQNPSTSVKSAVSNLPKTFQLYANYPNPFNPSTMISYDIPSAGNVTLQVYDILGREIQTLVNQRQNPGKYAARFDASKLSSGIYFYRLSSANYVRTMKMELLK